MKTLRNFIVTGGLLRSNGDEAQVGDTVKIYTYDEVEITAVIQFPIAEVNCGKDRSYVIEYEGDTVRVCDLVDGGVVMDCCALLDERVEVLENSKADLDASNAAPFADEWRESIKAVGTEDATSEIFVFGDSVLRGSALPPDPDYDPSWPFRIKKNSFTFVGASVHSFAVGGLKLENVASTIDAQLAPYSEFSLQTPRLALIGTGANDMGQGGSAAATFADLMYCVEALQAVGCRVMVVGCPLFSPGAINTVIGDYNNMVRQANADGAIDFVLDLERLPFPSWDTGLHPNLAAQQVLSLEALRVLNGYIRPASTSALSLPASAEGTITAISAAASAVITQTGHPFTTGQSVYFKDSDSTPVIDGVYEITKLSANTYSIPLTTTVAGTTGKANAGVVKLHGGNNYDQKFMWSLLMTNPNGASNDAIIASYMRSGSGALNLDLDVVGHIDHASVPFASPVLLSQVMFKSDQTVSMYLINKQAFEFVIHANIINNGQAVNTYSPPF